jgi:hypothetical protein
MSNAGEGPKSSEETNRDGTLKVTRDAKSHEKEPPPQDTNRDGTPKVTRADSIQEKVDPPKNTLRGG